MSSLLSEVFLELKSPSISSSTNKNALSKPLTKPSRSKVPKRSRPGYIKWVQMALNKALGLKLVSNGKMETQTRNAIRDLQKKVGLKAGGLIGPKTEQALIKASYPLALNISKIKSVRVTLPKRKAKVNIIRLKPDSPKLSEVSVDPISAITTIFNNEGDIDWELDQMKEPKHPWNQEKWGAGVWTSKSMEFYVGMDTVIGDEISAKFRINYKYNGHSVGYFHIENIKTEDAAFWGLKVSAKIFPDPNAYNKNGKQPVAAVEVNYNYRFHHFYWDDKIYSGQIKFYGDGDFTAIGKATQW